MVSYSSPFIKYLNFEIVCKDSYATFSFSTVLFYLKTFFYLYFLHVWFRYKFNCFFFSNVSFEKYGNFRERIRRYALLRSPFVNKKAREHVEFRVIRYPLFFSFNYINLLLPYYTRWFFILNWFRVFGYTLGTGSGPCLGSFTPKFQVTLFKACLLDKFSGKVNFKKLLFFLRYLLNLRSSCQHTFFLNNMLSFEQLFFFEYFAFLLKFVGNFPNFYSFKCYSNTRLQIYTNNLK